MQTLFNIRDPYLIDSLSLTHTTHTLSLSHTTHSPTHAHYTLSLSHTRTTHTLSFSFTLHTLSLSLSHTHYTLSLSHTLTLYAPLQPLFNICDPYLYDSLSHTHTHATHTHYSRSLSLTHLHTSTAALQHLRPVPQRLPRHHPAHRRHRPLCHPRLHVMTYSYMFRDSFSLVT